MGDSKKKWKQGPEGVYFTPEGALVWPDIGTVVVADLHLGYEATRANSGDHLPEWSLRDIQRRLAKLFLTVEVKKLIVAGDVTESRAALMGRVTILQQFQAWLGNQGVEAILLAGNHDRQVGLTTDFHESYVIQDWLVHHGHQSIKSREKSLERQITGHLHPVIKWQGRTFRVFISSPGHLILPAFTGDAAGLDILTASQFQNPKGDLHCWACSDSEVLDFGSLQNLRIRLGLS